MKKIAIVSDGFPPLAGGGIATSHYNLYRSLKRHGYDVHVFTFYDRPAQEVEEDITRNFTPPWLERLIKLVGGKIIGVFTENKKAWNLIDIIAGTAGAWRMNRALADYQPDVVILSDQGAPGLWLKQRKGMQVNLISHHNPARFLGEPRLGDFSEWDAHWAIAIENHVLRKVDKVSCPSNYMKDLFEATYEYRGDVQAIPNIVDLTFLKEIPAQDVELTLGLAKETPLICMPSVGIKIKGADYVAEIVRQVGIDAQVAFYIPGGIEPKLQQELDEVSKDIFIHMPGKLPYAEHIAMLKDCAFSISPAIHENYSMALVESVVSGVPMIAWDSGGNADIVHDAENGYLIKDYDVDEMIIKARYLVAQPEQLLALRASTRANAQTAFNPEKITRQYIDYFING